MNKPKTSKKRIAITTAALVAVGGGAAFAYWTSVGEGEGAAGTAGTIAPFTITSTAAVGGPLTPGGPSQNVAFEVTHSGTGEQRLNTVDVEVANADGTDWVPVEGGCSKLDYTVKVDPVDPVNIGKGDKVLGTVTITMNNLEADQNGCKGKTVPLYFSAR